MLQGSQIFQLKFTNFLQAKVKIMLCFAGVELLLFACHLSSPTNADIADITFTLGAATATGLRLRRCVAARHPAGCISNSQLCTLPLRSMYEEDDASYGILHLDLGRASKFVCEVQ